MVLHPWLLEQLNAVLEEFPPVGAVLDSIANQAQWERWQKGLSEKFTLLEESPPLRMLLIWDNLAGHKTPAMACWLMHQGIMPLYTPLGGRWLNMGESAQRILTRCALTGEHPCSSGEIIAWLKTTARAWNLSGHAKDAVCVTLMNDNPLIRANGNGYKRHCPEHGGSSTWCV